LCLCFKNSHHSNIIKKSFGHTFSAHGGFASWWLQEQEPLWQQQRQCQSLVRTRKSLSQQQEQVNGMDTNQWSNEVKYGRPI
jgi:hypothetical protein